MQTRMMVGVAIAMLVVGVALGSVAFPMTETETTTRLSLVTTAVTQTTTVTQIEVSHTTFTPSASVTITEVIVIQTLAKVSGCTTFVTTTTYTIVSNLPSLTQYFIATVTNSTSYATNTSTISATNVTAITITSNGLILCH